MERHGALDMVRDELLGELMDANTPLEMSYAISDAREWLNDHPDDVKVVSAMEDLLEVERELLGLVS
jgi:hypothetical protein